MSEPETLDLQPGSLERAQTLSVKLKDLRRFRDFAIAVGFDIPDDVIKGLEEVNENDSDAYTRVLIYEKAIVSVTKPLSSLNMPIVSREKVQIFRYNLLIIGIISLILCFISSLAGTYIARDGSFSIYLVTYIMLYGTSLGFLGAVTYELFHIAGVLKEEEFKIYDSIGNYARLITGGLLGWLFVSIFAWNSIGIALQFNFGGSNTAELTDYVFLLLPYLVGYSSSLFIGLMNNFFEGVKVALGISQKSI